MMPARLEGWRWSIPVAGVLATIALSGVDWRALPRTPNTFDDTTSDGDLARAILEGAGKPAEALLFARFSKRVFLYGLRHLRDESKAQDLAQDVMIAVIERLRDGRVREPDRIGSFILGTARWMSRDAHKRERRAAEVEREAAREVDVSVAPREPADLDRLADALGTLSERERAVVILSFGREESAKEIGEAFGLEPGHVRVIRHRAIARLGKVLGVDELHEEEEAV